MGFFLTDIQRKSITKRKYKSEHEELALEIDDLLSLVFKEIVEWNIAHRHTYLSSHCMAKLEDFGKLSFKILGSPSIRLSMVNNVTKKRIDQAIGTDTLQTLDCSSFLKMLIKDMFLRLEEKNF
jgi:hypothetical protein